MVLLEAMAKLLTSCIDLLPLVDCPKQADILATEGRRASAFEAPAVPIASVLSPPSTLYSSTASIKVRILRLDTLACSLTLATPPRALLLPPPRPARDLGPVRRARTVRAGRDPAVARADRPDARVQSAVGAAGYAPRAIRTERHAQRVPRCAVFSLAGQLPAAARTERAWVGWAQARTRPNRRRRSWSRCLRIGTRGGGWSSGVREKSCRNLEERHEMT